MTERRSHLTLEAAELLAVEALTFLASQPEALGRFMAVTGIEPAMLRRSAAEPAFLAGVLDYFLGDEPLLVTFAADARIPAEDIAAARRALSSETTA